MSRWTLLVCITLTRASVCVQAERWLTQSIALAFTTRAINLEWGLTNFGTNTLTDLVID